jgi:RimJ/RimL family protein N-acetyltransferase
MFDIPSIDKSHLNDADAVKRSSSLETDIPPISRSQVVLVPIRSLGENHRARIAVHLKALDAHDRYFRFGFAASDGQIDRYVAGLDFERDEIFGIYNRHLQLIAMAHLAYADDERVMACAEFGVSVLAHARGRGFGLRLFDRAMMHARNQGVHMLFLHVLSENKAMLAIARKAGATVERDGIESDAHLILPAATLNTQVTELVEEQMAQANYRIKVQAKLFRDVIGHLHAGWRAHLPKEISDKP